MFESKKFIYFNVTSFIYYFAWMMAWPIFTIYKVNFLHANNAWMSIFTIVSSIGSILAFYKWADLSNKRGNGFAVALSALLLGFIPLMWATAKNLYVGAIFDFLGGIAVGGYNMLLLNWLLELLPPTSEKMNYIAVFTLITQISAFIAPMFGMWLYTQMGYVAFMILTGIARIVVSILYFLVANYEDEIKEIEAKQ